MIVFPHAKVNLGLSVLRKRPDGFHDIESILYPIPLHDCLEVVIDGALNTDQFSSSGIEIPGEVSNNLCLKAADLLRADHAIPPLKIHLHKQIPTGAGLGGGSADGAYMLQVLNELAGLDLDSTELQKLALMLGSDCPFFLQDAPVVASGRGETMVEVEELLSGKYMVLVKPDFSVSTKEAYGGTTPVAAQDELHAAYKASIGNWQQSITNDFENFVFSVHPEMAEIKRELYQSGAIYASMTGTGSAVFGIFEAKPDRIQAFKDLFYWCATL